MGFRHLYIKNAESLHLKQNNILISRKEKEDMLMPLEDIYSIMLEDPNCMVSSRLISELASRGIGLVLCDNKYMPTSQVVSLNMHYNQVGILKLQLESDVKFKSQLWKFIIKKKILNQKINIQYCTEDEETVDQLDNCEKNVKVGDKENKEGTAARLYFKSLFGNDFIRFGSSATSLALNYGYSIISSSIIRQCIFYGLNTNFGIWHDSKGNPYNLAYDLIEAYRPCVDYFVFWHINQLDIPLPKEIRKKLINLLNEEVLIDDKKQKIDNAISITIQSYIRALECNDYKLILLPTLLEINYFENGD